jgi:predicted ATPase
MSQLNRIEVEGFKSIKHMDLELRPLNILIGANGSGKTNFISLFRLLNEMIEQRFQIAVRQGGGANALLYFGRKITEKIRVHLYFGQNQYECEWVATVEDTLAFASETGFFHGGGYPKPYSQEYGGGHLESVLPKQETRISRYVLDSMRTWKLYHFHDTGDSARVKQIGDINDNFFLRGDSGNLAAFLFFLKQSHSGHYEVIRASIRQVAPFFDDFILRPMVGNSNKIRLEWREQGSDYPFLAHQLSDGTLRFICLATLLLQPSPPSTIVIDEPELGLHPFAISVLASMMRSAAARTQVVASTQSVPLVNEFDPDDLIVVNRREHETRFDRIGGAELSEWLDEYKLGELWQKNVLGGRPSR